MATEATKKWLKEYHKDYNKKYPHRLNAVSLISYHVEQGNIKPPKYCVRCSLKPKRIMAHHHNYAYPLDVDWVCGKCHRRIHEYLSSIDWVDYIEKPKKNLPNMIQPDDLKHILNDEVKEALDKLLASINFTDREKEIIRLRAIGNTLQEIGYVFSVGRERIRQLLVGAERKYDFFMKKSLQTQRIML